MHKSNSSSELIMVTGASGHLGANLVRRLINDGNNVRVLAHPDHDNSGIENLNIEIAYADIRNLTETSKAVANSNYVYHCAAKISTIDGDAAHQREIFETNVIGTRNVLQAARESGVKRVVVTSSFSAVGMDLDNPSAPSDETMPFYPFVRTMPYERTKALAELECLKAVADGLDVVIATCCAIIGGNDFLPSRLGRTLCDYVNGKLPFYISGGFEFVSAQDIVNGHLLCMDKGVTGQKYIISTEYMEIESLVALFAEVSGVSQKVKKLPGMLMYAFSEVASFYLSRFMPQFPQRFTPGAIRLLRKRRHANINRARKQLGYIPGSIRDAVYEAYEFHHGRGAITNPDARAPDISNNKTAIKMQQEEMNIYSDINQVKTP